MACSKSIQYGPWPILAWVRTRDQMDQSESYISNGITVLIHTSYASYATILKRSKQFNCLLTGEINKERSRLNWRTWPSSKLQRKFLRACIMWKIYAGKLRHACWRSYGLRKCSCNYDWFCHEQNWSKVLTDANENISIMHVVCHRILPRSEQKPETQCDLIFLIQWGGDETMRHFYAGPTR